MTEPIRLLVNPSSSDGAAPTFDSVADRINSTEQSIEIFMFVWRSDEIGNRLGRAVLDAAERGVTVKILKDTAAFMYERVEMNRKSFFNRPLPRLTQWKYKLFGSTFPDTYLEDDHGYEIGDALSNHPNVEIRWVNHTHTKYYIFDEEVMVTGSINIEDRHRQYQDYMFEIIGEQHIERFRQRDRNVVPYDPDRNIDFLLNRISSAGQRDFEIKPCMIELLDGAQSSVYIEMAYIGDPDVSEAIMAAANRGVEVTVLFSDKANIGNDINWRSLHQIYRQAPVRVVISNKMIHSKLMLIDERTVIAGSANFSVFSMQKAVELDVVVRGLPEFLRQVRAEARRRIENGRPITELGDFKKYNPVLASLQQLHQRLT